MFVNLFSRSHFNIKCLSVVTSMLSPATERAGKETPEKCEKSQGTALGSSDGLGVSGMIVQAQQSSGQQLGTSGGGLGLSLGAGLGLSSLFQPLNASNQVPATPRDGTASPSTSQLLGASITGGGSLCRTDFYICGLIKFQEPIRLRILEPFWRHLQVL